MQLIQTGPNDPERKAERRPTMKGWLLVSMRVFGACLSILRRNVACHLPQDHIRLPVEKSHGTTQILQIYTRDFFLHFGQRTLQAGPLFILNKTKWRRYLNGLLIFCG